MLESLGFGVFGVLGLRVWGLESCSLGLRGLEFRVCLGLRALGLELCRVEGWGFSLGFFGFRVM